MVCIGIIIASVCVLLVTGHGFEAGRSFTGRKTRADVAERRWTGEELMG